MPRYPRYRPSPTAWLAPTPIEWGVKRLKFCASNISDKVEAASVELPYVGLEHIESWTGRLIDDPDASSDGTVSLFEPGDVLFGKLRPYLAKVHLAQTLGSCTTEALVLRSEGELHPAYLRYYLSSRDFISNVNGASYGSKMPRANWEFIGDQVALIPTQNEQSAIVCFLDAKTAEIDTLIAKKRRLLDLLAEQRAALITRAVTKGVDSAARLKPSGLPWLGDIPAHWRLKSIRYLVQRVRTGSTPPTSGPNYFIDDGIGWYTPGDFTGELGLAPARKSVDRDAITDGVCKLFPAKSVLMVGIGATLGKIGVPTSECSGNQQINAIIPTTEIDPSYLGHFLRSFTREVRMLSFASTIGIINQERTKQIPCLVPPPAEQRSILLEIERISAPILASASVVEAAINRLLEQRSALITAAVTGQIDVRNWSAKRAAA